MWLLTFAAMLVSFQGAKALGVSALLDLPAFVIAIVLLCSPGVVNKGNGGIKLFLELVALAVGLSFAFHPVRLNHTRAVYPYPVSPVRQIPGQPPFHAHFPPQPPMPINPPWVR